MDFLSANDIGCVTVRVNIGNLYLRLVTSRKSFNSSNLMGFSRFIHTECEKQISNRFSSVENCELTLYEDSPRNCTDPGEAILLNDTWELWGNNLETYTFHFKHYKCPYISVRIDRGFRKGHVFFEGLSKKFEKVTLYEIFDLRLFINWLANFGDIVLHASGFEYEGKAYCFLGESGRGKSTLVRDLAAEPGLTVLGEDQVILRYVENQFYVFGSPWHTDPTICSPIGARLEKLFFLDRHQNETLRDLRPLEVTSRVLQTAFVPWYRKDSLPLILERVGVLAENTQCLTLSYKLGGDGLETILKA